MFERPKSAQKQLLKISQGQKYKQNSIKQYN
jgi:hypothetical protein